MGAREVLASCAGWLMVSASKTTSCSVLASSNILSISLWTSAAWTANIFHVQPLHFCPSKTSKRFNVIFCFVLPKLERVLDLSIMGLLLRTDLLARDKSAVTRVIEILQFQWKCQKDTVNAIFGQHWLNQRCSNLWTRWCLLTFLQICVLGSQRGLSASYL